MSYFCSDCSYEVNYSYSIYLFFSLTKVDCGNTVTLISQTDVLPIDTTRCIKQVIVVAQYVIYKIYKHLVLFI